MASPRKPAAASGKPRRSRKTGREPASTGLTPGEVAEGEAPAPLEELRQAIARDGGAVLAAYRDPLGARWTLLAALPLDRIEPTPYQRDISPTHAKRLEGVVARLGRFLDPIIVVREPDGRYHTPNGAHRLTAMRALGARAVTALVVDDPAVAFQILALNTEKAHNLREKSLEVVRMYRTLARDSDREEADFALEFEEPCLVTLGLCYQGKGRFSGGAWQSVLRRVEEFLRMPLRPALTERETRAARLLALDETVAELIKALQAQGHRSPYLKAFVVARLNPLRFRKGAKMDFDECLTAMEKAAAKFDPARVRAADLASAAGPPDAAE